MLRYVFDAVGPVEPGERDAGHPGRLLGLGSQGPLRAVCRGDGGATSKGIRGNWQGSSSGWVTLPPQKTKDTLVSVQGCCFCRGDKLYWVVQA